MNISADNFKTKWMNVNRRTSLSFGNQRSKLADFDGLGTVLIEARSKEGKRKSRVQDLFFEWAYAKTDIRDGELEPKVESKRFGYGRFDYPSKNCKLFTQVASSVQSIPPKSHPEQIIQASVTMATRPQLWVKEVSLLSDRLTLSGWVSLNWNSETWQMYYQSFVGVSISQNCVRNPTAWFWFVNNIWWTRVLKSIKFDAVINQSTCVLIAHSSWVEHFLDDWSSSLIVFCGVQCCWCFAWQRTNRKNARKCIVRNNFCFSGIVIILFCIVPDSKWSRLSNLWISLLKLQRADF